MSTNQQSQQSIVDVRTRAEFQSGHIPGAINIPLNEISSRLEELKSMPQPMIICCLSGGRSASAASFLQSYNIDCTDGGGWQELYYEINNK